MNYTIEGAPLPVVICNLEGGETMLTEKGAMSWMGSFQENVFGMENKS